MQPRRARATAHLACHAANRKKLSHSQFSRAAANLEMGGFTPGAQLGHVAKNSHPPSSAREQRKGSECRNHRVLIGIVGIIQHTQPLPFPKLETHFGRLAF